jgi:hypothetical protein
MKSASEHVSGLAVCLKEPLFIVNVRAQRPWPFQTDNVNNCAIIVFCLTTIINKFHVAFRQSLKKNLVFHTSLTLPFFFLLKQPAGQRQLERSGCSKNVNSDKHWILLLSGRFEPHPIRNRAVLCRIKKNIGFVGGPKAKWTITSLNSNYEK